MLGKGREITFALEEVDLRFAGEWVLIGVPSSVL